MERPPLEEWQRKLAAEMDVIKVTQTPVNGDVLDLLWAVSWALRVEQELLTARANLEEHRDILAETQTLARKILGEDTIPLVQEGPFKLPAMPPMRRGVKPVDDLCEPDLVGTTKRVDARSWTDIALAQTEVPQRAGWTEAGLAKLREVGETP